MTEPAGSLWPILHYADTEGALRFLVDDLGFREALVARDEDGDIVHAELRWTGGGALVFGSTKHTDGVHGVLRPGVHALYLVTDDVDAIHDRATGGRGEVVEPPHDTEFGSGTRTRACTIRDPEGNLWTFGTYAGAP